MSTPIDLRSDTVTRPTAAMISAMVAAPLGDDVFDDDPTVHALQRYVAECLGKEAALFCPSGTMSNQIGIRVHCQPGDEFLCESGSHIYNYEQGAFAQLSGLVARCVEGQFGVVQPEQLVGLIRPDNEHQVRTRLVCLENTHNRGAGRVQPWETVRAISAWARANRLATHLDGARLFNAVVATGIEARQWADQFDTVSICFSKGLGAPVGSALAGPRELIAKARRARKLFGGGMRQAGVLASAALYALQHHVKRLADDHEHARLLANLITATDGLSLVSPLVETNILFVKIAPRLGSAAEFSQRLRSLGVLTLALGPDSIRLVTHLDVSREQIAAAGRALQAAASRTGNAA